MKFEGGPHNGTHNKKSTKHEYSIIQFGILEAQFRNTIQDAKLYVHQISGYKLSKL